MQETRQDLQNKEEKKRDEEERKVRKERIREERGEWEGGGSPGIMVGVTTAEGAAAGGWAALLAGDWAWGARGLPSRKARYCFLVSIGGVDTAKSDDGAGKKGIEN